MDTRRSFIKKAGGGTALSLLSLSPVMAAASGLAIDKADEKPMVLGIIGAENSHTEGMGKLFNVEKKFPGVELRYVWGETEEFAKRAMERGKIPNIVKYPREMLGKIDAVIVDHRHPKFHLEAVRPFVEAGIPAFVDKPFCYRVTEGKEFLSMARAKGTPVTSFSSIAQSAATFDMKEQLLTMGDISNVVCYGPADFDSPYGGIFFYGVHLVEPMMYMFGEDVERVKVTRNGKQGSAAVLYKSGLLVTLVIKSLSSGWDTFVETKKGVIKLASRVPEPNPGKNYADMVAMFRTRKEPRTHESILKGIAILEALEQSAQTEQWTAVIS